MQYTNKIKKYARHSGLTKVLMHHNIQFVNKYPDFNSIFKKYIHKFA